MIAGLVLAAGAARRFGAPKQLAELDGRPLLEHVLASMSSAPLDRTIVVLGAHAEEILEGVDLHGAESVLCRDWGKGQAASLRAGLLAAAGAEAVVVGLGDQPFLTASAWGAVASSTAAIAVATYGGRRGQPVRLAAEVWGDLPASGDEGARRLLFGTRHAVVEVACPGDPADIDTQEDLRRWS